MTAVMRGLCAAGLVLVLALPVILPGSYWVGLVWLAVLGGVALLGRLWPGWLPMRPLGRRGRGLAAVLVLYAVVQLTMASYHGELVAMLPWIGPLLLPLVSLVALHVWLPRVGWLWGGLALGGMTSGGWSLWQKLQGMQWASVDGPLHTIVYGNLGLLTGALCLAGIGWGLIQPRRPAWLAVLAAGAAGGVLAAVFSGTCSGWVALPLILLVFHRGYGRWLSWRQLTVWWLGACVLLVTLYTLPQTGVQQRVDLTIAEVKHYVAGERTDATSVSLRLEMWHRTLQLIGKRPLLGRGETGYHAAMLELAGGGELDHGAMEYAHAHNDLLDAWAKRGLLGLGMLLVLYLLPLWLFHRGLDHLDTTHRALAVAGLLLPVVFIDIGLSYSFLSYPVGVAVYTGWLVVLWSLYRHAPLHRERMKQQNGVV